MIGYTSQGIHVAEFGKGTVLLSEQKVQMDAEHKGFAAALCLRTHPTGGIIGKLPEPIHSDKYPDIVLAFSNEESLDVVIQGLERLRCILREKTT